MTTPIWRIGTDTPDYAADDLSGTGAKITGGRWNRKGTPMLYCASNISLACLETIVHLGAGSLPLNRYLIQIDVPKVLFSSATYLDKNTAPVGWDAEPTGKVSLDFGTDWCSSRTSALLCVPSTIVPEELNVLINPLHPDANKISFLKIRKWIYDARVRP